MHALAQALEPWYCHLKPSNFIQEFARLCKRRVLTSTCWAEKTNILDNYHSIIHTCARGRAHTRVQRAHSRACTHADTHTEREGAREGGEGRGSHAEREHWFKILHNFCKVLTGSGSTWRLLSKATRRMYAPGKARVQLSISRSTWPESVQPNMGSFHLKHPIHSCATLACR